MLLSFQNLEKNGKSRFKLEQWFSTLEARRPTKDEYENFSGPPYSFIISFVTLNSLIELELTYLAASDDFMANMSDFYNKFYV